MKIEFKWEKISKQLGYHSCRAKVIGGWVLIDYSHDTTAMDFIPDPKHSWEVE